MNYDSALFQLVANGAVTLVAAFAGAWAAFLFERSNRKSELMDEQTAAGNRALFVLTQIWNKTQQQNVEIVADWKDKDDAWLNMPESLSMKDETLRLDSHDLSFLLLTDPVVFQQVFLEIDRFHSLAGLIDRRNEMFLNLIGPALKIGEQTTEEEIARKIGDDSVRRLKEYTLAIIAFTQENLHSSREAFTALREALLRIHPERKFIQFKIIPLHSTTAAA